MKSIKQYFNNQGIDVKVEEQEFGLMYVEVKNNFRRAKEIIENNLGYTLTYFPKYKTHYFYC